MKRKIIQTIRKRSIIFSASIMLVLVLVNTGFLIYNNQVQKRATAALTEAQDIKSDLNLMWDEVVRNLDLGLRGYALIKDDGLLYPFKQGKSLYNVYHPRILEKLKNQGYPDVNGFLTVKQGFDEYIKFGDYMVELVNMDSSDLFKAELKKDKGRTL